MEPFEKIEIDNIIIVLADLQPEIIGAANKTIPEGNFKRSLSVLLEGAEVLNLPVFLSAVPLHPGVDPVLITELSMKPVLVRRTPGVFDDTSSIDAIKSLKRSIVVLGGVATELAVLQTALGARRHGYGVHLLTDLCGGLSLRTEEAAFRQLEAAGVTISSVPAFLSSLIPSPEDPRSGLVFAALARFMG